MTNSPSGSAQTPTSRSSWHRKTSRPILIWFAVLILVALFQPWVPNSRWLLVHMVALGMVTNAILIWSQHFTEALLKNRSADGNRRLQAWRLGVLNTGIAVTIAGMLAEVWTLTLVGSVLIGAAVAWHALHLLQQLRHALPARFSITVKFYIAAALLLPVGAAFGATLASGPEGYGRFMLAHQAVNLLGFVGLTVVGTLITLWPTMLRTRMVEGMAEAGRTGLSLMLAGTIVTTSAALLGWKYPAAFGVLLYLAGFGYVGLYLVRCAAQRRPDDYPTFSVGAALLWLTGSLAALLVLLLAAPGERGWLQSLTVPLVAGFAAQTLLGAMSYLLPTVLGGGPTGVRNARAEINRFAMLRISLINAGLLVWILPLPQPVDGIMAALVLVGFVSFLPLLFRSMKESMAGGRALDSSVRKPLPLQKGQSTGPTATLHLKLAAAGMAIVLAGTVTGLLLAPADASDSIVDSTGETTTVQVFMWEMRYFPDSVAAASWLARS